MLSASRRRARAWTVPLLLASIVATASLGSTCVTVDEDEDETAWRNESTEQQMQQEEVDELDRENEF